MPEPFHGVGAHFRDFHQLDDEEVRDLLHEADRPCDRASRNRTEGS
jgi:predicted phosphoribosyltransferase